MTWLRPAVVHDSGGSANVTCNIIHHGEPDHGKSPRPTSLPIPGTCCRGRAAKEDTQGDQSIIV